MRLSLKTITVLLVMSILAACTTEAESQTLRERMRERAVERAGDGDRPFLRRMREGGRMGGAGGGMRGGGSAELPAGTRTVDITVGGQQRRFYVIEPSSGASGKGAVMVLHGGSGDATSFIASNPMRGYVDQRDFVAVYPQAIDGLWNDGRATLAGTADDVAFVRGVVDWLSGNLGVDRSRVFATGLSNGAVFSHRLACDAPDLVAGIAPVAGSMSVELLAACSPSSGTPVAMFMGTEDPLMVYNGGRSELSGRFAQIAAERGFEVAPAEQVAAFWAARNGCGSAPDATRLPDRASDGTTVTLLDYCPRVELYRIEGGGHTWPGGTGKPPRLVGAVSQDIDASAQMLTFFETFGL